MNAEGWQEGHMARKKLSWFVDSDSLTGALHVLQLQLLPLTTSIIVSSNKIQNGDILVPANPGPPEKCPLNGERNAAVS